MKVSSKKEEDAAACVLCPQNCRRVSENESFPPRGARRKEVTVITDRLALQSWNAKPFSRLFFYLPRILKRMDGNYRVDNSKQQAAKDIPLQQRKIPCRVGK
jgi:hypothetical protein